MLKRDFRGHERMHLRLLLLLTAILTCACQSAREPVGFHTRTVQNPREIASRLYTSFHQFNPLILYDARRDVINVAVFSPVPIEQLRSIENRIGVDIRPGFYAPSVAFKAQIQCMRDADCDTSERTACEFEVSLTRQQFDAYFTRFAEHILHSGYAALGVFYRDGRDGLFLTLPLYDQCADGNEQMQFAWRQISNGQSLSFSRTR